MRRNSHDKQMSACFVQKLDLDCVKQHASEVKCELVPNAVDCGKYFFKNDSDAEPQTLIFTGNFKYWPNCHAIDYFMRKIFPSVQRTLPGVKFLAVGNGASQELRSFHGRAGFEAVDFVSDLRPYLARATVAVAPLTVGSGVSNKLVEGFAVGTPVVATPLACGDLPVTSGAAAPNRNDPGRIRTARCGVVVGCGVAQENSGTGKAAGGRAV